jgi:AcrR family transcriptional regulator
VSPRTKEKATAVREEARSSIVGAALRVFTRRGYFGTTMADVAREARVSYGLAYHYFRSKDALFIELVRLAYEGSYGLFRKAREAFGDGPAGLRAVADGILSAGAKGEAALYFQIVIQAVTLERVPRQVTEMNTRFLPLYSAVLEEMAAAGKGGSGIDHRDQKGAVTCFLALILGLPIILARHPGAVSPESGTILRLFGI